MFHTGPWLGLMSSELELSTGKLQSLRIRAVVILLRLQNSFLKSEMQGYFLLVSALASVLHLIYHLEGTNIGLTPDTSCSPRESPQFRLQFS